MEGGITIVQEPPVLPPAGIAGELVAPAERHRNRVDFNLYTPGTVQRRTLRRMALQKLRRLSNYAQREPAHCRDLRRAEERERSAKIICGLRGTGDFKS